MTETFAFMTTVEEAHQVARHIVLNYPPGTPVGFNRAKTGEGYVTVDVSFPIADVVREVTGGDPLRVLSLDDVLADPDMHGVQIYREGDLQD
jgi:hypothetical protein